MSITVDGVWAHAQRLSIEERRILFNLLLGSLKESEENRKSRAAVEIDRFFGGWSDDPRSSEERLLEIREARTSNTMYLK